MKSVKTRTIIPGIILTAAFLAALISNATAQGNDQVVIKKTSDFNVTGDGASENWSKTGWIDLQCVRNNDPAYVTKVKVLYSGTGIYFLYSCSDRKLVSTLAADNTDLWNEDVVEFFLWTDENFPVYFEYELSPLNYELPIIVPNFNGKFKGWLPWHYEGDKKSVHMTTVEGGEKKSGASVKGWTAEIFIPYKLLDPLNNVPPVSGTRWRANMYRLDYDSGMKAFVWQKVMGTFHEYKKFGTFIFE
jgi:hypothetical protein